MNLRIFLRIFVFSLFMSYTNLAKPADARLEIQGEEQPDEPKGCCKKLLKAIYDNKLNITLTSTAIATQLTAHNMGMLPAVDSQASIGLGTLFGYLTLNKDVKKSTIFFFALAWAFLWLDMGLNKLEIPFQTHWSFVFFISFIMRPVIEVMKNQMREAVGQPRVAELLLPA